MKHQGEQLRLRFKSTGIPMEEIANKLGMTRQNLAHHLRKEVLTDDFARLVKSVFDLENNNTFNDPLTEHKPKGIPYYDVDAAASNVETFNDKPLTVTAYIDIPSFSDCNFYVNVFGHSMYPKYCSGEIIACKKIEHTSYLPFGEAFLIKLKDGNRYVKYIRKSQDKTKWLLASENDNYDPFEVPIDMIESVWIIKGKITKNMI